MEVGNRFRLYWTRRGCAKLIRLKKLKIFAAGKKCNPGSLSKSSSLPPGSIKPPQFLPTPAKSFDSSACFCLRAEDFHSILKNT